MAIRIIWFLSIVVLSACRDTEGIPSNEDIFLLSERFHGRYKALSSVASEALDVNKDGVSSTDLLVELAELNNTYLELRMHTSNNLYFKQFWPEQAFTLEGASVEPTSYNPMIEVKYEAKAIEWLIEFNRPITEIIIQADKHQVILNPQNLPPPESVTIKANDQIQVVTSKRLYTRSGWKTIKVVTLYERYTKNT